MGRPLGPKGDFRGGVGRVAIEVGGASGGCVEHPGTACLGSGRTGRAEAGDERRIGASVQCDGLLHAVVGDAEASTNDEQMRGGGIDRVGESELWSPVVLAGLEEIASGLRRRRR